MYHHGKAIGGCIFDLGEFLPDGMGTNEGYEGYDIHDIYDERMLAKTCFAFLFFTSCWATCVCYTKKTFFGFSLLCFAPVCS